MASSHKLNNNQNTDKYSSQEKSLQSKIPENKKNEELILTNNENVLNVKTIKNSNINTNNEEYIIININSDSKPIISKPQTNINNMHNDINIITTKQLKFDFDDILIMPKSQTNINSRYNDINPYYKNNLTYNTNRLPLMTAPMDSVINNDNIIKFQEEKINIILPRTEFLKKHKQHFNSFGLNDSINEFDVDFALLDIANGHMSSVLDWCYKAKKHNPNLKIMAGNIANPKTFHNYCSSGVIDYARIGIGNGNGCLTTQQTGIGYPMGSLISECYEIKINHSNPINIVADGGMKKYSDIIKALALGADYVMIGSVFNKALESSASNYWNGIKINNNIATMLYNMGFNIHKEFRGMSTKQVQKILGNKNLKTSEGVTRRYKVEYTLKQWVDNFEHYLRSAMSYTNSNTLQNFIGKVDYNIITNNSFNRFNK